MTRTHLDPYLPIPGRKSPSAVLPSQWELSSLAAILSAASNSPKRFVDPVQHALAIWREAGAVLAQEAENPSDTHNRNTVIAWKDELNMLKGPLKIGNQILPRVETFTLGKNRRIGLLEFSQAAIGLSKLADRNRWLRAFAKSMISQERGSGRDDQDGRRPQSDLRSPKVTSAEVNEALSALERDGVPEPMNLLDLYRRWRLKMNTPIKKRQKPHDLRVCYEAAKLAEKM